MKDTFYTLICIGFCLLFGKIINYSVSGLPASLYGMIVYCALLQMNIISVVKVALANQWIIRNMGVCFVPAGVGIINHFELIKDHGLALIGIIFISTFILLTFVGLTSERMFKNENRGSANNDK